MRNRTKLLLIIAAIVIIGLYLDGNRNTFPMGQIVLLMLAVLIIVSVGHRAWRS